MNFLRKIIEDYKLKKQQRKAEDEEMLRIKSLNEILDKKIPTANIIKCENYLNQVEYFLLEFSPRKMVEMLSDNLEFGCHVVQLTGEDAGERFFIPKPCYLSKQKNEIPAYFLMNSSKNISLSVNAYGNFDIQNNKKVSDLEAYSDNVTLRQIFSIRDNDNSTGNSVNLENSIFIAQLNRLEDCDKIINREINEISVRKG